jgi:hypothetical protein
MIRSSDDRLRWIQNVICDLELTIAQRIVGVRLACYVNKHSGQCNPSYDTLARGVGLERRSVINAVNALKKRHWLIAMDGEANEKNSGGRSRTNRYMLVDPPAARVKTVDADSLLLNDNSESQQLETVHRDDTKQCTQNPPNKYSNQRFYNQSSQAIVPLESDVEIHDVAAANNIRLKAQCRTCAPAESVAGFPEKGTINYSLWAEIVRTHAP